MYWPCYHVGSHRLKFDEPHMASMLHNEYSWPIGLALVEKQKNERGANVYFSSMRTFLIFIFIFINLINLFSYRHSTSVWSVFKVPYLTNSKRETQVQLQQLDGLVYIWSEVSWACVNCFAFLGFFSLSLCGHLFKPLEFLTAMSLSII